MTDFPKIIDHEAVRCGNDVVVFGGMGMYNEPFSHHIIWMYNLYTEQWRQHQIPEHEVAPPAINDPCAVAIGTCIYLFGGTNKITLDMTNALWKLTKTQGYFHWDKAACQSSVKLPSPRWRHSGWEYGGCLWIFGGYGSPLDQYLNDHGDFTLYPQGIYGEGFNNQLLCYDPSTQTWTNPECFGAVPLPQCGFASTIIQNKVWLFDGADEDFGTPSALFQIDMHSQMWTQIESGQVKPDCINCSLTAISETELILVNENWGGSGYAWIMNLTSHTWKLYTPQRDHRHPDHAVALGVNRNVIITGGSHDHEARGSRYPSTCHVMLEPKSLQQLAMKTIYNQRSVLPWKCLPKKLIVRLGLLGA